MKSINLPVHVQQGNEGIFFFTQIEYNETFQMSFSVQCMYIKHILVIRILTYTMVLHVALDGNKYNVAASNLKDGKN